MNRFLSLLLNELHLSEADYEELTREVTYDNLEDPFAFHNIGKAAERIQKAMENKEKIMVYGDYDCDGFMSVSILVRMFQKLNYAVGYYIPSRYHDGYGINEAMVEVIASKGYQLIITVDNGVAQTEALTLAKEKGIDVILTDHHEMLKELPPCYCCVHPFLKDTEHPLPECGAYVAFELSRVILKDTDPYLLTMASLATISDLMPLKSYNRTIVRLGLKTLEKYRFPQFHYLVDSLDSPDEKLFSFTLAPKINAVGRIIENNNVNRVVRYFTSEDDETRHAIGNFINECNDRRKLLTQEADKKLDYSAYAEDKVIVVEMDDLSEGLIGLLANRILNEAKKPCVVFTKDIPTGNLKGSARSLEGFPLSEVFLSMSDLLVRFGGHASAGGLVIEKKNLDGFRQRINELAEGKDIHEKAKTVIPVLKEELNYENYLLLRSLAPFGEGFEEPYFSITVPCSMISYLSSGAHIKGTLNPGCTFIGFNFHKNFGFQGRVQLIGRLETDTYRKGKNLSFKVSEVIPVNE